jgi:hypothetical protein
LGTSPKVSFRKCWHNRNALPDDCFYYQRNSWERIRDKKILAVLDPTFLERCSKSRANWGSTRNVKIFAGVRNEWFWWHCNRWQVLVSTHHGLLENVYPFGSRCHSKGTAGLGAKKLWLRCSSTQKNLLCSMFFQEIAHSINYISLITDSLIRKHHTWIVGARRASQRFGCTWIIPYAISDRRSRQKWRRTTFSECRTHRIH